MNKPYKLALHIFRRDLRLQDNTALIEALSMSEAVIPCFIFDPRQLNKHAYKSEHSITFMHQSLMELDEALQLKSGRLYYFHGIAEKVVARLLEQHPIDAVFINRDYTPFSIQRDQAIEAACRQHKTRYHRFADALLNEPEHVFKADKKPYTVFTPYRNKAIEHVIALPVKNDYTNYYKNNCKEEVTLATLQTNHYPHLAVKGGRKEGIALLKRINTLTDYADTRNIPALNGTSKLSAHHKFGAVSIRETYHQIVKHFGKQHTLLNELYWRDFFTQIAFHFPHVFGHAFHEKYDKIKWHHNEKHFHAWCEGKTGFPIVDAGMRELNTTGYMHNRVRMITASFLTKDLHIDWREGERYFAQQLIDYDPAVNNGNWQWAASTGCDAQPYFRIFNPWLQQTKYDPDCTYIKQYIPELANNETKLIHNLENNKPSLITNYPAPIVNHTAESAKAKLMYRQHFV